jgi:hypothetical protein
MSSLEVSDSVYWIRSNILVVFLQIEALLRSCQKEHADRTELLHTAVKTADLGILLGAPLTNGDFSMTRVAGLLSDALSALSSG